MICFHRKGQIRLSGFLTRKSGYRWMGKIHKYMKTILVCLGGEKCENLKRKIMVKTQCFQKQTTDCYIQNQFYNCIDNEDNRSFSTKLKQTYEKDRF